jgi:hypothetical protein
VRESVLTLPKWKPKQLLLWESLATEMLIAGDTRSGKSFFVRKAYILYSSMIPGLISDILRLNYDDVLKNYMVGETSFPVMLDPWEREGLVKVTENQIEFWNGSLITLGHCADEKALRKHQGNPTHLRTIDEGGQLQEAALRGLGGWLAITEEFRARLPEKWRNCFPKIWHLTNFIGPGMGYYRRGFLAAREPFQIEEVGQHKRQFVPMHLSDNDSEDAQKVIARIKEAFPDPAVQKALLECDWRAAVGNYFPEWDETRHVLPDFKPPRHWFRYRTYDHGTAEPFACYWWAVSDGEPFECREWEQFPRRFHLQIPTPEGFKPHVFLPRGALVAYREWYGADMIDPSKGLRMRNEDIADGVLDRSPAPEEMQLMTLTDSWPFRDEGGESIAMTFAARGWVLQRGDTSRTTGWSQMRSRLIGVFLRDAVERFPLLYFVESCRAARDYIPALPRHPSEGKKEDAAEHGEATHAPDAIRLACMAHKVIKDREVPSQALVARAASQKVTLRDISRGRGQEF